MQYPNMASEVIEAIHLMYEDEPSVEVDCYLYLTGLSDEDLVAHAQDALAEMGRCPYCGTRLEYYITKEIHTELDGCPEELIREEYCPHCDIGSIEK